jgi:hypothetical protein
MWSATCGAMRHNDQIILAYAVSDTFSNFAAPRALLFTWFANQLAG